VLEAFYAILTAAAVSQVCASRATVRRAKTILFSSVCFFAAGFPILFSSYDQQRLLWAVAATCFALAAASLVLSARVTNPKGPRPLFATLKDAWRAIAVVALSGTLELLSLVGALDHHVEAFRTTIGSAVVIALTLVLIGALRYEHRRVPGLRGKRLTDALVVDFSNIWRRIVALGACAALAVSLALIQVTDVRSAQVSIRGEVWIALGAIVILPIVVSTRLGLGRFRHRSPLDRRRRGAAIVTVVIVDALVGASTLLLFRGVAPEFDHVSLTLVTLTAIIFGLLYIYDISTDAWLNRWSVPVSAGFATVLTALAVAWLVYTTAVAPYSGPSGTVDIASVDEHTLVFLVGEAGLIWNMAMLGDLMDGPDRRMIGTGCQSTTVNGLMYFGLALACVIGHAANVRRVDSEVFQRLAFIIPAVVLTLSLFAWKAHFKSERKRMKAEGWKKSQKREYTRVLRVRSYLQPGLAISAAVFSFGLVGF
jgi:hypothetical protein